MGRLERTEPRHANGSIEILFEQIDAVVEMAPVGSVWGPQAKATVRAAARTIKSISTLAISALLCMDLEVFGRACHYAGATRHEKRNCLCFDLLFVFPKVPAIGPTYSRCLAGQEPCSRQDGHRKCVR